MKLGFDLISDLNLTKEDQFSWEGKPTSLYCIVAGNISNDLEVVKSVLTGLSKIYHGVFYISGFLEETLDSKINVREITKICKKMKNVAYLHNNVVIVDGVGIIGINGWYGTVEIQPEDVINDNKLTTLNYEDIIYLRTTIEKLQLHLDVKKIIVVSNCTPLEELFFGEVPNIIDSLISPQLTLISDLEGKISHWVYGGNKKIVDTNLNGINYINNSSFRKEPYWPKRIEIDSN